MSEFKKPEYDDDYSAVDYYNMFQIEHCIELFLKKNPKVQQINDYVFEEGEANIIFKKGVFTCDDVNSCKMIVDKEYTPFMMLSKYMFKNNNNAAYSFVGRQFRNENIPYIRVGVNYFKKIVSEDRFGIKRMELKRWTKEEIKEDEGKAYIKKIEHFDTFTLIPDNLNYNPVINNAYNMYHPFSHTPRLGEFKWTEILLRHTFGDQYELGLQYLQVLYLQPKQVLPILVLSSKIRSTGKSTFLNWMSILFGQNMVVVTPTDLASQFNSAYANANIIGIEETVTEKSSIINKLKDMSTNPFINLNQKFVDNSKIPFFGKFIITTNDETKFMKVDDEEIRFWVRKLDKPKYNNVNIADDLIAEIPAFLAHLKQLPEVEKKSRMVFTPEQIKTEWLQNVKEESRTGLYKELKEIFISEFEEKDYYDNKIECTIKDIKEKFFSHNNQITFSYLRKVLKEEFKLTPSEKSTSYTGIDNKAGTGRFYTFTKDIFTDVKIVDKEKEELKELEADIPF